jgi:DNA-directed RNA polymerase specialized sigma24 family protein
VDDRVSSLRDPLLRQRVLQVVPADEIVDGLYRANRSRLVSLAAAITLDRTIAEEVVQDAFVGLQRRLGDIDDPVGYLQRSVVNQAISVIRRRRVAARHAAPVARVAVNPEIDETWAAVTRLPVRERSCERRRQHAARGRPRRRRRVTGPPRPSSGRDRGAGCGGGG